jgi:hypothetical protein
MWGFRALGDGWLDYHNLVGLQSSLMLTLCTFCLFDAEWKTGNIMHRLPCKYALNLILCKHDLTKGRNLDQNFQHYTEKSRACVCMPCRSHSRTLNPEAFVEERAETIERSEIVEVRTYPPAREFVSLKVSLGAPGVWQTSDFTYVMSSNPIRTSECLLHSESMHSNFIANFWKTYYLQFFKFVTSKLRAWLYATPTRFLPTAFTSLSAMRGMMCVGQQVHHSVHEH